MNEISKEQLAIDRMEHVEKMKQNDPPHGENCNDIYTACKKCYTEFREWQIKNDTKS